MLTAGLFTIAKTQKLSMYPLTQEWIKKCDTHTTEYYSAIKKTEIVPFVTTRMEVEGIMLGAI